MYDEAQLKILIAKPCMRMPTFFILRSEDTYGMWGHKTHITQVRNNWWFLTKDTMRVPIVCRMGDNLFFKNVL